MATTKREEWPEWAQRHFPLNPQEARNWEPELAAYPLHRTVLVVAITRVEGAWAAYCDTVPGHNHRAEKHLVLPHGDKVDEKIARAMFPGLDAIPYAR